LKTKRKKRFIETFSLEFTFKNSSSLSLISEKPEIEPPTGLPLAVGVFFNCLSFMDEKERMAYSFMNFGERKMFFFVLNLFYFSCGMK